ncbi:mannitol dehydrogenase family protein [Mesorhizobium sp. SB112]|uniref:mannitol dehydrogenase family protein n=1 Tax=Mesorhizobium sp. SB112 TaxID=3151853 RepID=UPI003263EEB8
MAYRPEDHGTGIVHIGVGAFHKAHQAVYTDTAIAAKGGDWRILGVSLRSTEVAATLNPQGGRYTLVTRDEKGDHARIIGSIAKVIVAPHSHEAVIAAIADSSTKIVTLTVTEKAYGIDRASGGLDVEHPAIAHDLTDPDAPTGVVGFLVAGLKRRMETAGGALTILCCDNLPENGKIVSQLVLDFSRRTDALPEEWISQNVRFPSSMVDRITPASTPRTFADAESLTGYSDNAAVETEPFTQWVIEDDFTAGRPAWEAGGALFVKDVTPYEKMKLRLLNGTHSLLAYAGFLAGHETISEAVCDASLARLAERQMIAAANTLPPIPGIDRYRAELLERFSNKAIRHLTYQIAMDGTEKLPQRILAPLAETVVNGGDTRPFCFAIAAWMRYCLGVTDNGNVYNLRDPRQDIIAAHVASCGRDADRLYDKLSEIAGLLPGEPGSNQNVRSKVIADLQLMLDKGMVQAIRTLAK